MRMPDSRTKASTCSAAAVLRRISGVEKFIPRSSTACFRRRRASVNLVQASITCSTVSGISHWSQEIVSCCLLVKRLLRRFFVRGCCRWWKSWWKAFVLVESLLPCEFVSALIFLFSIFCLFFGVNCFPIRVEIFHYFPRTCLKYRRRVRFAARDGRRWPRHVGVL